MSISLSDNPPRRRHHHHSSKSPLLRKIVKACRSSLPEPDLVLNLDVADYINDKQGANARDAVMAIGKLINNQDHQTAILALSLLDVLVKNCGYPIHLQISRKDFLNLMVQKFPEFPPSQLNLVQHFILKTLEEWYQTLCKHTTYKDDLLNIQDMHSLLYSKGYTFPTVTEVELSVLTPNKTLMTQSEIAKEQEIAQGAKLDELIRSGKPEDLRKANKLMKVMAGFKLDNLKNAQQEIINELSNLKIKIELFDDMINNILNQPRDDWEFDTLIELYGEMKSTRPKLQRLIEEQDSKEMIEQIKPFDIQIGKLISKYDYLKLNDLSNAKAIVIDQLDSPKLIPLDEFDMSNTNPDFKTSYDSNQPPSPVREEQEEINLLDFGDDDMGFTNNTDTITNTDKNNSKTNNSEDLLADLLGDFEDIKLTPATTNQRISLDTSPPVQPTNILNESKFLKINYIIERNSSNQLSIKFTFTNLSTSNITNLTFLLAVPKRLALTLKPQTNDSLTPLLKDGIQQIAIINNIIEDESKPLKLKWKVNYSLDGTPQEETNVYKFPVF
ncbi:hypothetical protein TBLA_0A06570 [Henningerozyma blattae CBS 6284]|uniref:VHS domain-containing protein n=1 Tax=Henningerozyma blattae (strain ATCC 34711 / CBS 6284 / DSM 70876 / NBRC 10599 / NRRL Y-10934 / UCD 77-7) TaxID=1071380 RepID=I2GWE7_HENB6|nr:hypothetical protein TBLA_0A06570 [Tetrapisispora blattae CBS 6284]CCH58449.1 hypothetical protein TBLA_0A06570 [Tetrapisispora blattae CBS 6284]